MEPAPANPKSRSTGLKLDAIAPSDVESDPQTLNLGKQDCNQYVVHLMLLTPHFVHFMRLETPKQQILWLRNACDRVSSVQLMALRTFNLWVKSQLYCK